MEIDGEIKIKSAINDVINADCGFEVFVMTKDCAKIMRMNLYEGDPLTGNGNFKAKVRTDIIQTIKTKFLSEDADYCQVENIVDNQNKFYVIPQDEDYKPFDVINTPEDQIDPFSMTDRDNAKSLLFRFTVDGNQNLWAYQHIHPTSVPNKKKDKWIIKAISKDTDDVFVEMTDNLFTITRHVDILIVPLKLENGEEITEIVSADLYLLERFFGFEQYIRSAAGKVVKEVTDFGIIANNEKLEEYLKRSRGKKEYSRKMMRIKNSKVFEMTQSDLMDKINSLGRWKGVFQFDSNNKVVLTTFKDVENLIDLFDERYVRSDVTGQEYDASAKSLAKEVSSETADSAQNQG